MTSEAEQTIDNLCKRDKMKVLEMLKQVNELRKRCSCLESQIEAELQTSERLEARDASMSHEIDTIESKFAEATALSQTANAEIQRITVELQQNNTDNSILRVKVANSEDECSSLRETYRQLRQKYDHILVDASVACHPDCEDKEQNTVDDRILVDKDCQFPGRESATEIYPLEDESESRALIWTSMNDEMDDDMNSLILMLNHH
jgi:chromosome segregation ATPase